MKYIQTYVLNSFPLKYLVIEFEGFLSCLCHFFAVLFLNINLSSIGYFWFFENYAEVMDDIIIENNVQFVYSNDYNNTQLAHSPTAKNNLIIELEVFSFLFSFSKTNS